MCLSWDTVSPDLDKATSKVTPQQTLTMESIPKSLCVSSLSTLVKWSILLHESLLMQYLQHSPDASNTSTCPREHDTFVEQTPTFLIRWKSSSTDAVVKECLHKMLLDLPVYTNDINLLQRNLDTENKSTALLDASTEDGLQPHLERTKYTLTPINEVQDKTFYNTANSLRI
jgi:hypothetical protein